MSSWISKNHLKAVNWLLLTVTFGLMQIWLLFGTSLIVKSYLFPADRIFLDGGLLFFASALIASIAIDHHIYPKRKTLKYVDGFMYTIFPILLILACVWIFSICMGKEPEDIEMGLLTNIELAIVSSAIIYAIFGKISQN